MKEKTVFVFDYKERIIWLDGSINPKVAVKFQKVLARLNKLKLSPIIFYIRGPGGDPYSTLFMMSAIVRSASPVAIIAYDYVNSGCFTITQAASYRLALKGTKFSFHPAEVDMAKQSYRSTSMTQEELIGILEGLRLIDGVQLVWFLSRGKPVEEIFRLFINNSTISLGTAKRLCLMDDYYKEADFIKDKKLVRRIIKAKP